MRPLYIALEGIEGCGKTTQAALLAKWLGSPTILTREPGGTDIGQQVRQIVLHRPGQVDPMCEALLFAADRSQHIAEVVKPALDQGRNVVSDRSLWSSIAYQGFGRELNVDALYRINGVAVDGVFPTLVFELEINLATMKQRMGDRQHDRIEKTGDAFFERVINGFVKMRSWADCERWINVDATQSQDFVFTEMCKYIEAFVAKWWS